MRSNLPMLRYRRRQAVPLPPGLFSAGEVGFWGVVHPSVLWQDTARTTPVTAPAQTVASWLLNTSAGGAIYAEQSGVSTLRPTYGVVPATGRRNLLTFTEQFSNAAWVKTGVTITPDAVTAPDGTVTGDAVVGSSAAATEGVSSAAFTADGVSTYTASLFVQKTSGAGVPVLIYFRSGIGSGLQYSSLAINTTTGFVSFTAGNATIGSHTVTDLGTWWRVSITAAGIPTGSMRFHYRYTSLPVGTTTHIWGAQLETGSTATAYQRVVSSFDVAEAGVASLSYLGFDGSDDFLVTPTITPNIDKVQVFAGVRKLSDVSAGMIVESSTSLTTNNGSFYLIGPSSNGLANYSFVSKGTTLAGAAVSGYPAPISSVITGLGDISGDRTVTRVNGALVGQNVADQGTGNYLAYPLYIGRRAGTTFPFNGHIYGLVVRFGPNLDMATIAATERWMATKTGVTL